MLTGTVAKIGVRENSHDGLWALHVSTPQFWAWQYWLFSEFGYAYRPISQWRTAWGEWPPTTQAGAQKVAQRISDLRDELRIIAPIKRHPAPWDGKPPQVPDEFRSQTI